MDFSSYDPEARMVMAEAVARLFPGSTIRVRDIAPVFVPEHFMVPDEEKPSEKLYTFPNGSRIEVSELPF